jgi:hypothetical protein
MEQVLHLLPTLRISLHFTSHPHCRIQKNKEKNASSNKEHQARKQLTNSQSKKINNWTIRLPPSNKTLPENSFGDSSSYCDAQNHVCCPVSGVKSEIDFSSFDRAVVSCKAGNKRRGRKRGESQVEIRRQGDKTGSRIAIHVSRW